MEVQGSIQIRFVKRYYTEDLQEMFMQHQKLVNLDDYKTLAELIERASLEYQISPTEVEHFQYKLLIHGIRIDLVKPPP